MSDRKKVWYCPIIESKTIHYIGDGNGIIKY